MYRVNLCYPHALDTWSTPMPMIVASEKANKVLFGGFKVTEVVSGRDYEVLELFKDQDVRLLRKHSLPENQGYEFSVFRKERDMKMTQ